MGWAGMAAAGWGSAKTERAGAASAGTSRGMIAPAAGGSKACATENVGNVAAAWAVVDAGKLRDGFRGRRQGGRSQQVGGSGLETRTGMARFRHGRQPEEDR